MISTRPKNAQARGLAAASILNSLLLPVAAASHFNVTFWALVITNFVLMHSIWMTQLPRVKSLRNVDWGGRGSHWPLPLLAFGLLGTGSYAIWETELASVFPS